MKWSALVLVLAAVPALRIALPQRSAVRGPMAQGGGPGPRYVPVDFDNDGLVDVYAIEPSGLGRLLAQLPDGSFVDRTEAAGLAEVGAVAGAYWKDLTNDPWLDLVVVKPDGRIGLFLGDGQSFSDQTDALAGVVNGPVQVVAFEDYDANGWLDLGLWGFDGSVQIVQNHGELIFAPGEIGSTNGGLRRVPVAPVGPLPLVAGGASGGGGSSLGSVCADQIIDQLTGQCINASSTPAIGRLYPLSSNLFVSTGGNVGIHTTVPTQRLDVSGVIRATGGFQFPDGTLQTTATAVGPAGATGLQGPEGQPGTTLPAGTVLMTAASTAPSGFLLCDGAEYLVGDHPDLAVAIGTTYGGSPGVTFRVPDMRQRFAMGRAASGTGATLGATGGAIDHTHASAAHTHDLSNHTHQGPTHSHPMAHDHSVPAHYHSTQGSGADINIISDTSEQHVHDIGGKISSSGTGNTNRFVIADGSGTNTEINAGTGSPPGAAGEHIHGHGSFSGRVGTVTSGANGDGVMTTGGSSAGSTSSVSGGGTSGPSINSTGSTTPAPTGVANPPFLVINYIIKR